jgi:hypothetical protein
MEASKGATVRSKLLISEKLTMLCRQVLTAAVCPRLDLDKTCMSG